ncbi:hypothetical protein [Arthrobacter sp. 31Y]|uniref:hypothetical protein n=1 Tax=Arthrobacter sp. 31Y TaxID=1115632 RepID=UPI000467E307|nr:hypothetical protein [Arthrobacter sp. 31Y]
MDSSSGITGLVNAALWIVIVACVVLVLVMVLSRLNRRRLLREATAYINNNADWAHGVQAELLETIQFYSENQRQPVNIVRFWKGRKVSLPVQTALVGELVDARVVGVVPVERGNAFLDFIADLWISYFCWPPRILMLSDRDWLLMVNSKMNGREILIERLIVKVDSHDTNNTINTGGGDLSGVAQGGRDASLKMRDMRNPRTGVDARQLRELVLAMHLDAERASDPGTAAKISAHAVLLEQDIDEPESIQDRENLLERIAGLVTKYGDAMVTTMRVLGSMAPDHG